MFYHFRQNNSGGSFDIDSKVTVNVIIEAESAAHANELAQVVGIYFDGCYNGTDCTCCGDRWRRVNDSHASDFPAVYGMYADDYDELAVEPGDVMAYVYYLSRPRDTVYQK